MAWWRSWRGSLLALVLVFGAALVHAQPDSWWRNYQPSAWGSPRGVSGLGSLRGGPPSVAGWGASLGYSSGASQSRQGSQQSSPIGLVCGEDKMSVTVMRDFYGNRKLVKASDLSLGPQSCKPDPQSSGTSVLFNVGLQECGNTLQMTRDWLVYTTRLNYSPKSPSGVSITRTNPAVVPIQCYYYRHGNVSSKAIHPTWTPFSSTVTSEERLSFSLQLMSDDWSAPRSTSIFKLGDTFSIEASVAAQNHAPMILFVDSCVATLTPDPSSSPRYEIIAYNGCLMDGKQEDSSSAFRSPRARPDKLQFSVDAFRFVETDVSVIYISCVLRASAIDQPLDPMNKACSYRKTNGRWSAVEGSSDICQCCDTGDCATAGHSRSWVHGYGGRRGIVKREEDAPAEEQDIVVLGPLLVIKEEYEHGSGSASSQASRMEESRPLELWMLVAIGSISFVVVVVVIVLVGKCILDRTSCGGSAEK